MSRGIRQWLAGVTIASLIVFSLLPIRIKATLHGKPAHNALHILIFGFTTWLCLSLTNTRLQRWIGLLSLILLATAIEVGQSVEFHQRIEWADVGADCLGSIAAFGLFLIGRWRNLRPRPDTNCKS
jgi:hypothetical protein